MCGIIAVIGEGNVFETLIDGLERLEYRGYDSAGVAVKNGGHIEIHKSAGEVEELVERIHHQPTGHIGLGHTRWSTHGPPTDRNAHPHRCKGGNVAVVHNGVITNYEGLRQELIAAGHTFESETDTEVIPHLIASYREEDNAPEEAFRKAIGQLEGNFAISAIIEGKEAILAARRGAPLILGIDNNTLFFASDTPAFLDRTNEVIYIQDGDVAVVTRDGYRITGIDGEPVERERTTVEWEPGDADKGQYQHFMLKEIHSQPTALANTIEGRIHEGSVALADFPSDTFSNIQTVRLVGCGTSYHAALYGEQLLAGGGVHAHAVLGSEYESVAGSVDDQTLVIAVSQSGETADTLTAIRRAQENGAMTVGVTNVLGSTLDREVPDSLYIRAGPEIGVAATKTFSAQAVSLALLAQRITTDVTGRSPVEDSTAMLQALEDLPEQLETVLAGEAARRVAEHYLDSDSFFFIGRGLGHPVAIEAALKFKEITYEHAEGFPSGELKHGPLALVTDNTPVFAIVLDPNDEKTETNASEAAARGAPIITISDRDHSTRAIGDDHLPIPHTHPVWAGLLANVQLQLLAYHAAKTLGRPIDKPRNLAKSVTVD